MRRWVRRWLPWAGRVAVLGGLATLAACGPSRLAAPPNPVVTSTVPAGTAATSTTTAAAGPTAPALSTSGGPATGTTSPSGAEGTYTLSANPACGEFAMNGALLVVRGSTAAITQGTWDGATPNSDPGPQVVGSVTRQGSGFHVRVANGRVVVIDLTGSVNADGTLTGTGQSGGVHINPETGWVCDFSFTATGGTSADATGQTVNEGSFYSPSRNISCEIQSDAVRCQTTTPPRFVTMSTNGAFTICSGDNCLGNIGEGTPILAYGATTVVGPFKCVSATSGVTCTAGGTGFKISRAGVTKVP